MCRLNPKADIVFRKLFGSEDSKHILKSFINSILPEHEQVKDLTIKNPYNLASYINSKNRNSVLDIKAQSENDVWFDIEIQIGEQEFFGKRITYYVDKVYVDQLGRGENYEDLNKVIGIAILDFNYFPDERYIRGITNKDIETNERYEKFDLKDIYFIELRKFNKELKFITNTLDRWVTFLTKASFFEKDNIPPELAVDPEVSEAVERLDIMYLNEKEQEIYEAEEKFRRDQYEIMRTAISKANRKGMEEGLKEGMEKGRKEGMEKGVKKGLKEGMEKGRKEGIEIGVEKGKIETAKNLLKNGVSVDIIKSSTGLSEEDIESLR